MSLHRRLAYVPGEVNLWPNLSESEAIDLFASLRGGFDPTRRDELLERSSSTRPGAAAPTEEPAKVALVAAFASDVELLVLDEPTSGSIR